MASIRDNKISAVDMNQVLLLNQPKTKYANSLFTPTELADQEARRKRKVRKLEYEVR
jgi:hypothetical protein